MELIRPSKKEQVNLSTNAFLMSPFRLRCSWSSIQSSFASMVETTLGQPCL